MAQQPIESQMAMAVCNFRTAVYCFIVKTERNKRGMDITSFILVISHSYVSFILPSSSLIPHSQEIIWVGVAKYTSHK